MTSTILTALGKKLTQSLLEAEKLKLGKDKKFLMKIRELQEKVDNYEHLKNLLK